MSAFSLCTLILLLLVSLFAAGVHGDCFWPDATENDGYEPCYSAHGGAVGLCCRSGDVCLANGVCSSDQLRDEPGTTVYYRGSCIYRDWGEGTNCPTACINGSGISPHDDVAMEPCPNAKHKWYCVDNDLQKANCSTGDFIVTLSDEPVPLTTIGVSPSNAAPSDSALPGSSFGSTTMTIPVSANSTSIAPSKGQPTGDQVPPATRTPPSLNPSSTSSLPHETFASGSAPAVVPLAVGVSLGGAFIIFAGIIGFLLWHRRNRNTLARAETPPPRDAPDGDIMSPALSGPLFRAGSLLYHTNGSVLNAAAAAAGKSQPTSILNANRPHSLRAGSILNTLHQYNESHNRFGPDTMAMHNVRRTPSRSEGFQSGQYGPETDTKPPEIPYDGRRFAPYAGIPDEVHGYSELPG